jgi:hypothetical protein
MTDSLGFGAFRHAHFACDLGNRFALIIIGIDNCPTGLGKKGNISAQPPHILAYLEGVVVKRRYNDGVNRYAEALLFSATYFEYTCSQMRQI